MRVRYTSEELRSNINAPPEHQVDSVRDEVVMTKLLHQADRAIPGGFLLNKQGNSVMLFEDSMHQIIGTGNNDEALRVFLHDGDPDL